MIEGKNIQLRTVKEKDLPDLYFFLDSIRLKGEYLPGIVLSEHQLKNDFFQTGFWEETKGTILICVKERLYGAIWFEKQPLLDCLDLHFYIFRPEDRGKGVMSEALPLFCSYLFDTKKIHRLQISIPDYSKAALRIAQKSRFQFEGIARGSFFQKGQYLDLCIYSLLRSDLLGSDPRQSEKR